MFGQIIAILAMLVFSAEAQSSEAAACAECMHLSYELRNVPSYIGTLLDSMFSSMMNPACEANTVQPQTCEPLQFPAWMEHKCIFTQVTLMASNLIGLIPNAEMDVTVTVRGGCHAQWQTDSGGDGCISLSELDEATQAQMTQQLASLSAQWETVTYSGSVCMESP